MDIVKTAQGIYTTAKRNGFHDDDSKLSIPKMLALIHSELSEALESHRKNNRINDRNIHLIHDDLPDDKFKYVFEHAIKDTFEDELADVQIRILDFIQTKDDIYLFSAFNDLNNYWSNPKHEFNKKFMESIINDIPHCIYHFHWIVSTIYPDQILPGEKYEPQLFAGQAQELFWKINFFCEHHNIDIEWHIEKKMKYNSMRSYKHGGKEY